MRIELKQSIFKEIKALEQKYKRNQSKIDDTIIEQSDISARIQILLNKL